ncbi:hypothetical protein EDD21DRAFT_351732 [Dissophora ornata]|nr:hypothetical protein EDD21DRAFT_351732 [Dissophora ornata]
MKNLFRVLLTATFAIASSVAIQEVLQAEVEASTLDSPSPVTIVEEALWYKKDKHHHHKQCRSNIIALPFPECRHECKDKCKFGGLECGEECKFFEHDCNETCGKQTGECRGKCEHHKDECGDTCKNANIQCDLLCDSESVTACDIALPDNGDLCRTTFSCETRCKNQLGTVGTDANCNEDWCKGKCEHGEHKCRERCKPCKDECKEACYQDEERCFSNCKSLVGSDQECRNKCNRNCGSVCERRCKHCGAGDDVDADTGADSDAALADATAPEENPTIAAVSA